MSTLLTILITVLIAAWFLYSIYTMWRGSTGRDCASCSLGGGFDYSVYGVKKVAAPRQKVFVMNTGHRIVVDEEAARRRRERIRQMMEGKK